MDLITKLLELDSKKFEELCFELIYESGYSQISWRQGGSDSGRDIQAILQVNNKITGVFAEKWFFECKRYTNGVPPAELNSKIAWADAEKPDHITFFISSYLTTAAREWIEKISPQKPYRIHIIEGKNIEKLLLNYPTLIRRFFNNSHQVDLIESAKKNWITFNFLADFLTIVNILESDTPISSWSADDICFLLCSYYFNYEYMQLSKDYHYDFDDSKIALFENELINGYDSKINIFNFDIKYHIIGESGIAYDEEDKKRDFNAILYQEDQKSYLSVYLIKRTKNKKIIEINIEQNTSINSKFNVMNELNMEYYSSVLSLFNENKGVLKNVLTLNKLQTE